jgi:glycosyltransferase involved in cell wall biosynthesis
MRQTPFLKELHQQIARAAGRVVLTGFLPYPEMPRAYLLGDVFVGPSQIEEGLGLVFLEAAAAGLPIIATARGGIPEVVQDGGNALLLQRQDDPGELAEKILELLRDRELRQRLGRQGREWVSNNFSWEQIAHRLEQVYDEVRGRGSGAGG